MKHVALMEEKMDKGILAWHFIRKDRRMAFGTREPIKAGVTYKVDPPLELCHHGLHASERIIDALTYAAGPVLCRVRLSGEILKDTDKLCATKRTVLVMADFSKELHEFACNCAERALWSANISAAREAAYKAARNLQNGQLTKIANQVLGLEPIKESNQ